MAMLTQFRGPLTLIVRRLGRWGLCLLIGSLLLGPVRLAWSGPAVVTTNDGRQYVGPIVAEDEEGITLLISGIHTPIPRSDIQNIQYPQAIEDEYRQRKSELESDDLTGHYQLAKWLFDHQRYDLAHQQLKDLHARLTDAAPQDLRYQIDLLDKAVSFRLSLQEENQTPDPKQPPSDPQAQAPNDGPPVTPPQQQPSPALPKLTDEQINAIKVFELPEDLFAAKPNVRDHPADHQGPLRPIRQRRPAARTQGVLDMARLPAARSDLPAAGAPAIQPGPGPL